MKFLLSLILITVLSLYAFAEDLPTVDVRKSQTDRYLALPGFPQPLEFVRDGVKNDDLLIAYLTPKTSQWVQDQHLKWLQIRDVYVDVARIQQNQYAIIIPVVLSFRYVKPTNTIVIDGTANGEIQIVKSPTKSDIDVKFVQESDSQIPEFLGKKLWDIQFDTFMQSICNETIYSFVSKRPQYIHKLLTSIYGDSSSTEMTVQ